MHITEALYLAFAAFQTSSIQKSSAYVVHAPQKSTITNEPHQTHSRRDALKQLALLAPISLSIPSKSNALEQCKVKSHNCIRTFWTAPPSLSSGEAITIIRDVINSYPQGGQAGVDCNGWTIVEDSLDNEGKMALEFISCVGPAALAINLGQPFIDDLKLEFGKDAGGRIVVEVKSNSRVGGSDLFVNRKRLLFLADKLRDRGWDIPAPKYVYEL